MGGGWGIRVGYVTGEYTICNGWRVGDKGGVCGLRMRNEGGGLGSM